MSPDPIKHVVLLMLENHSFDQMLGSLQSVYPQLDGVDVESPISRSNLDSAGRQVFQVPTAAQQVKEDPKHETKNVLAQIANENTGFVTDFQTSIKGNTAYDRQQVMGYYVLDFLPALHQLAHNFTVCDRWFSSLPGPTWPNRFFALSGTSSGKVLMPEGVPRLDEFTAQDQVTLFDRLNEAQVSWKVYFYDFPLSLLLNHQRRAENLAQYSLIKNFYKEVTDEKHFPSFVFIEPKYLGVDQNDDHPPHNVFKAEKLIADVYNAIRSNHALWQSMLLVVTYDEHGGFYDHALPPATISPDERRDAGFSFNQLGVRVPTLLISPWVGARVEKTVFDHTSLLKYLVDKWQLAPLGARTAAANSIGVALRAEDRSAVLPFIRVPYTDLIPNDADLEKTALSHHQKAIHAFALFLAREESAALGSAIEALSRGARWWVKLRGWIGPAIKWIGKWLSRPLDNDRSAKVSATAQVVREQISQAQIALGARMLEDDT